MMAGSALLSLMSKKVGKASERCTLRRVRSIFLCNDDGTMCCAQHMLAQLCSTFFPPFHPISIRKRRVIRVAFANSLHGRMFLDSWPLRPKDTVSCTGHEPNLTGLDRHQLIEEKEWEMHAAVCAIKKSGVDNQPPETT